MTFLGLIVLVVGGLGLIASFMGMTTTMDFLPTSFQGITPWLVITAIGGVLYFFTRRARG